MRIKPCLASLLCAAIAASAPGPEAWAAATAPRAARPVAAPISAMPLAPSGASLGLPSSASSPIGPALSLSPQVLPHAAASVQTPSGASAAAAVRAANSVPAASPPGAAAASAPPSLQQAPRNPADSRAADGARDSRAVQAAAVLPVAPSLGAPKSGLAEAAAGSERRARPGVEAQLSAAAAGLERSLTLSGPALKHEAGRPFEGQGSFDSGSPVSGRGEAFSRPGLAARNGVSAPESSSVPQPAAPIPQAPQGFAAFVPGGWAAAAAVGAALAVAALTGLLPGWAALFSISGFFLIGGLQGDGSLDNRYQSFIRSRLMPGDRLGHSDQRDAMARFGLSMTDSYDALNRLAERGLLAAMNDGTYIVLDYQHKILKEEPVAQAARHVAKEALEFFNKPDLVDHALAFHGFSDALSKYAHASEVRNELHADWRQTAVMRENAGMQLLRSMLQFYDKTLQDEEHAGTHKRRLTSAALLYAETAVFSAYDVPEKLDSELADFLDALIGDFNLDSMDEHDDFRQIAASVEMLRQFVRRLEAGKGLLEPVSAKRALVPIEARKSASKVTAEEINGFKLLDAKDDKFKALYQFGANITERAAKGQLDPMIGRKKEVRQMVKILRRTVKNNPVVIGEKGVGKSHLVNGLAAQIVAGEIPSLVGVNIFRIDVTALVAGTKYRGEFEDRLKAVVKAAEAADGKAIIFFDELHTILGLGGAEGTTDASQLLKNVLEEGKVRFIGTTTLNEFRKIEKDGALERRFGVVKLSQPSEEEAIEIVRGVKGRFEGKHNASIPEETVVAAVVNARRYVKDKSLPDSALDLLDDASIEARMRVEEAAEKAELETGAAQVPDTSPVTVTPDDIAFEVHLRTGIPAGKVSKSDKEALKRLEPELNEQLIGQEQATGAVARAIRRSRQGYGDPKQPVGTFVFLGPTGVGKTELVRVLARNQFDGEADIVRIDMSEYMERHAVSRLISAPPGYIGHEEGGQLTEPVRRNPYTVVLLDEIEKAHPDVLNVLLQVMEDGRLTDSMGRTVDFSNVILVMTSNIGGSVVSKKKRPIGFGQGRQDEDDDASFDDEAYEKGYQDAFKEAVRPEFYNRVGKRRIVVFRPLNRAKVEKILTLRLSELNARMKEKGVTVTLTEAARKRLVDDATSAENRDYGARPLKQAIEEELENALSEAELNDEFGAGDSVTADYDGKAWSVKKT